MSASPAASETIRTGAGRYLSAPLTALAIGYAGLLVLMAFMAIDAAFSHLRVEMTTAALRTDDRKRDELLDDMRFDIYHSGSVLRDYLLESDNARAESERKELELFRTRIDDNLRTYEENLPSIEKSTINDLHHQVDAYWKALIPALEWDAASRRAKAEPFLENVVRPFRAKVSQLARQVSALNQRDLERDEESIRTVERRFRRRVVGISVITMFLGVTLVVVSLSRFQYLEREASSRFREVVEARRELRNLSDRLVTAQEEERRSLSRELHDEIGQGMSAMLVELGRLEAAPDNETRRERLSTVRRMAETSVATVRNMALLLRPSMLDDLGLVAALRWQAREVERRSELTIKMVADEIEEDFSDAYRTCTYRVVQEALNNCARHSRASQVRVVVHRDKDNGLLVRVEDNGIGFEPSREKGMGILGIEERVGRLGGRFSIESGPGKGTVLSIHFPIPNRGPDARKDTV